MADPTLTRHHRARLMQIWRSAGWPCKDGIEIDLLAAGLVSLREVDGRELLRLTEAGVALLAESRRKAQRALSLHDRLAMKFADQLMAGGRIVWRELSLRALIEAAAPPPSSPVEARVEEVAPLWNGEPVDAQALAARARNVWRMARPDLFSVRLTTVAAYLQPVVHEIKASRADLQSDLRHAAKREAYRWLCSECHYVFPAGIAEPDEIPAEFGVWVLHGAIDEPGARFEQVRAARHRACELPFAVWLALARATPLAPELADEADGGQASLGEDRNGGRGDTGAEAQVLP